MELLSQLLGYIFMYLILRPILFVLQAIMGLLVSETSPRNKTRKWVGVALLIVGCMALSICWFGPQMLPFYLVSLYALGFVLLAAASAIGYELEKQTVKMKSPSRLRLPLNAR